MVLKVKKLLEGIGVIKRKLEDKEKFQLLEERRVSENFPLS